MIYVLISGISPIGKEAELKSSVDCIDKNLLDGENNKRDCRVLGQPLSLLPEEIDEFINNTKNESLRAERRLAYTTLFLGLREFFGADDLTVAKNSDGKPYLVYRTQKYQKNEEASTDNCSHQKNKDLPVKTNSDEKLKKCSVNYHVSISHSDGVIAVVISDEGEIGIDIQSVISSDRAERLKNRFFEGMSAKSEAINAEYYYCSISDSRVEFEKANVTKITEPSFTAKWVSGESILKLSGRGFGDLNSLDSLSRCSRTEIVTLFNGRYFIATSVLR